MDWAKRLLSTDTRLIHSVTYNKYLLCLLCGKHFCRCWRHGPEGNKCDSCPKSYYCPEHKKYWSLSTRSATEQGYHWLQDIRTSSNKHYRSSVVKLNHRLFGTEWEVTSYCLQFSCTNHDYISIQPTFPPFLGTAFINDQKRLTSFPPPILSPEHGH